MPDISDILARSRTACRVDSGSKKRLFETIAQLITDDQADLEYSVVLDQLIAREKLGSTGLGGGIAIPHCRIENCPAPLGSLVSLQEPIDFDAPDDAPVDLLFILIVPAQEHQEHLDILATVARLFSQPDFCARLRDADTPDSLFDAACEPIATDKAASGTGQ